MTFLAAMLSKYRHPQSIPSSYPIHSGIYRVPFDFSLNPCSEVFAVVLHPPYRID
jgi:hypothetical protein